MVFKFLNAAHKSTTLLDFPFTLVDERKSSKATNKKLNVPDPEVHERVVNKFVVNVFTQECLDAVKRGDLYSKENCSLQDYL